MDPGSGTFYAPFAGYYGFMFYARSEWSHNGNNLFGVHNGNWFHIHLSYTQSDIDGVWGYVSNMAYFALYLNPGDSVKINSGNAGILNGEFSSKFTGFLLNKA